MSETYVDPRVASDLAALDPDLAPVRETSLLDVLEEVAKPVEHDDVVFPVKTRPGWAVRYATVIDMDQVKRWRKSAGEGTRKGLDEVRFACILMANLCRGISRNGEDLLDGDEEPVTFGTKELWQLYDTSKAADTVRAFYGDDIYLASTLDGLLIETGIGEEVAPLDPTQRS